MYVHFVGVLET